MGFFTFAVLYDIPSDLASSVQFIPLFVPSIARILSSLVCFYTLFVERVRILWACVNR